LIWVKDASTRSHFVIIVARARLLEEALRVGKSMRLYLA